MPAQIIDCSKIADGLIELAINIAKDISPKLAIVLMDGDYGAQMYAKSVEKDCKRCGFECEIYALPSIECPVSLVRTLNERKDIDGIIVMKPIETYDCYIYPIKDLDGAKSDSVFRPCTAQAIHSILHESVMDLTGMDVVIINRSEQIGLDLARNLIDESATVTVCHSQTKDLSRHCREADIIVTATGKAGLITEDMVSDKTIVVDAGISKGENGVCGDVDPSIEQLVSMMTSVPGGVGIVTRAVLMVHLATAAAELDRRYRWGRTWKRIDSWN